MLLISIKHLYWSGVCFRRGFKNGHQNGHHVFSKGRTTRSKDVNHSSSLVNMIGVIYMIV